MTVQQPSTEDLEREVVEERQRVDETLDQIQRRLTPGQLIDEVLHHGRGAGTDFVANLGRTLAANPVPAALVGVGLLWLLLAPKPQQAASAPAVANATPAAAGSAAQPTSADETVNAPVSTVTDPAPPAA